MMWLHIPVPWGGRMPPFGAGELDGARLVHEEASPRVLSDLKPQHLQSRKTGPK